MPVHIIHKSKPEKGETLTMRISSKDKFALDLLARKRGLTLSAVMMEALKIPIEEYLTVEVSDGRKSSKAFLPDVAYDPLTPDRLVKLALNAPELLTIRQQVEWKVIKENPDYWGTKNTPNFRAIREDWEAIQDKATALLEEHSM